MAQCFFEVKFFFPNPNYENQVKSPDFLDDNLQAVGNINFFVKNINKLRVDFLIIYMVF